MAMRYSDSDDGIIVRSIRDRIDMTDNLQAVLPKILGFGMANVGKHRILNWPNADKVEWIVDNELPVATTLNNSGSLGSTDTTFTVTHAYIRAGDVIKIGDELIQVTGATGTAITTVAAASGGRAYGDSNAAIHTDGSAVEIVYRANTEGGDFQDFGINKTSQPYNHRQIFRYKLSVSRTRAKTNNYGINDEMAYQLGKLWDPNGGLALKQLENTFFNGQRVSMADSWDGKSGSMGGFKTFVTTNVDSAGGTLDMNRLNAMLRAIYEVGRDVEYIMAGPAYIEYIMSWFDGYRMMSADNKLGGFELTTYLNKFGRNIKLLPNYRCPATEVYLLNSEDVSWIPIDEFKTKDLPTANDATDMGLYGEYSMVVRNENGMGYFTGLDAV